MPWNRIFTSGPIPVESPEGPGGDPQRLFWNDIAHLFTHIFIQVPSPCIFSSSYPLLVRQPNGPILVSATNLSIGAPAGIPKYFSALLELSLPVYGCRLCIVV